MVTPVDNPGRECAWCRRVYVWTGPIDDDWGFCSDACDRAWSTADKLATDRLYAREPYEWEEEEWN